MILDIMRRRILSVTLLLVVPIAACSEAAGSSPTPDLARPLSVTTTDHCVPPRSAERSDDHHLVSVGADPTAVDAVWFPGLNTTRCATPVTHAAGQIARRLALDIRRAKPYGPGRYNCPADFEEAVRLYFRYAGHRQAQTVLVTLSGCSGITAPGRSGLALEADAIRSDLAPITPAGIRKFFD